MREIAWSKVKDIESFVKTGDTISVKVLNIDWDQDRITLSIKQTTQNPWDSIEDTYHETKQYSGTVTKLTNFGAFVALEPGIWKAISEESTA